MNTAAAIAEADTSCQCRVRPAVNFNDRKEDGQGFAGVDMLVLHYTGMETGKGAEDWLCVEESGVSCHYLVHEDGEIVQMVAESQRAWHAGKSFWRGHEDINSRSIGIEIVNPGHEWGYRDFTAEQLKAVIRLCKCILRRHDIEPRNVVAHSDIAPARKMDPGEKFPWHTLFREEIGLYVPPNSIGSGKFFSPGDSGEPIAALQAMLSLYGYGLEVTGDFDEDTELAIAAFQRHFRPQKVDGIADMSTISTLHDLLRRLNKLEV